MGGAGNLVDIYKRLYDYHYVDKSTGCWLFTGRLGNAGYGVISYNNIMQCVHRLSAHLFLDLPLDSPLYVLHKQQCPNRNCWNPEHLYIGTHIDNMRDM